MAGIGFRLQALVEKGSYLEATTAYLSSAAITSGPWLVGTISLGTISAISTAYLSAPDHSLLFGTIIWVFAISQLVTGGLQMLVTRYLADRFYLEETTSVAPTCTGVLLASVPLCIIALPFLILAPFALQYRLLVVTLFMTEALIWMIMIFLTAARKYLRILLIFTLCSLVGIAATILLGQRYGMIGCLAGFTSGQMLCLSLLIVSIYQEFPSPGGMSLAYIRAGLKYRSLFAIGTLYLVSTWIDSIVFWLSPQAQVIHGFYHLFPPYDTVKFIMYLSTIPAAVTFMLHLETNFYRQYQRYYHSIHNKGTLANLGHAREGMRDAVVKGTWKIIKVQGLVALFLCLIAPRLILVVGLSSSWLLLFWQLVLAGVAQFLLFVMMLLLLYIDQRRAALLLVGTFAVLNGIFTLGSLYLGEPFYGSGCLIAALISAILGWFLFHNRLKQLDYLTFMLQPL